MVAAILLSACGVDMPGKPDGEGMIYVTIADTSGIISGLPGVPCYLDSVEVGLQSRTHTFAVTAMTDENGRVSFGDLATGEYLLTAVKSVMIGNNKKVFSGRGDFTILGEVMLDDTILVDLLAASELMINEIYYCGATCIYYMFDQFVELYNSSSDTLYLDGIILTRQLSTIDPDMETNDYVRALYAYQFPGTPVTGREYPILPGQFVVIASDAVNHQAYCSTGISVDLSNADWECFNPLGNDYDNVAVPNIVNINPSRTTDYLINLVHNAVVIANGESYGYETSDTGSLYLLIPIETIIDGVEYASSATASKELTVRVDAGFAGIGITRYSATSTERRQLGLDTNDSTFDFDNVHPPTPGWSHVAQ
jgi:hypothetical protein